MKPSNASRKPTVSEPATNLGVRIVREGALIGLVAVCLYLLMAMFSYDVADGGWSSTGENQHIENLGGRFGAWIADIFFSLFGYLAYLFPVMLAYRIVLVFRDRALHKDLDWVLVSIRTVGLMLVMIAGTGLAAMHFSGGESVLPYSNGGLLGSGISSLVDQAFSYTGGTLLLLALFLFGLTIFTDLSWLTLMDEIGHLTILGIEKAKARWIQYQREKNEKKIAIEAQQHRREVVEERAKTEARRQAPVVIAEPPKKKQAPSPRVEKEKQVSIFDSLEPAVGELPPLSLLDPADKRSEKGYSKESLEAMSKLLELKLKDFGIDIEVVSVQPGPVVTRFEIQPAAGIKASRISGLAKDLARSLAVVSVRVVEVIPGKSFMGIEIPNA
ncbi:MAG: DNA translocase FtsK, partial [Moraxellaceae bacterium]